MFGKSAPASIRLQAGLKGLSRWRGRASGVGASKFEASMDRRRYKRWRVRLKWGKALDLSERFLCDCLVVNRSDCGARLRLARKIALPTTFLFFDDAAGALYAGRVIWRQGGFIGCRLSLEPLGGRPEVVKRMSGPYYAL